MIARLILSLFALGFALVLGIMVLPIYLREFRQSRPWSRFANWFIHDGLPMILLFLGACSTLLLFWILDAAGFNHVTR